MSKSTKEKLPKVTVDKDLRIIKANSSFYKLFDSLDSKGSKLVDLSSLIEFENLESFKCSFERIQKGKPSLNIFNATSIDNDEGKPILVKIDKISKNKKEWSNEIVRISLQLIDSFSSNRRSLGENFQFDNCEIFDNSYLGICLINDKNRLIYANETFFELTETKGGIIENFHICKTLPQEIIPDLRETLKKIREKKLLQSFRDVTINLENDKKLSVRLTLQGLFKEGKFFGCLVSFIEIGEIEKVENQEEEIRNLKKRASDCVNSQLQLQQDLDLKVREQLSNEMLISQKNDLLKLINRRLKNSISTSEINLKNEVRKIISMINSQTVFDENWESLKVHFVKMNPQFFATLKLYCDDITEKELRHCAYMKMGLNSKESAHLLAVLPKSVEMARYRIKKKLKLAPNQKLSDFIRKI